MGTTRSRPGTVNTNRSGRRGPAKAGPLSIERNNEFVISLPSVMGAGSLGGDRPKTGLVYGNEFLSH